jgi:hypothetical protein
MVVVVVAIESAMSTAPKGPYAFVAQAQQEQKKKCFFLGS